jgi:hypothetical protein
MAQGWFCLVRPSIVRKLRDHIGTFIGWFHFRDILYASLEFCLRLLQLGEGVCEVIQFLRWGKRSEDIQEGLNCSSRPPQAACGRPRAATRPDR